LGLIWAFWGIIGGPNLTSWLGLIGVIFKGLKEGVSGNFKKVGKITVVDYIFPF